MKRRSCARRALLCGPAWLAAAAMAAAQPAQPPAATAPRPAAESPADPSASEPQPVQRPDERRAAHPAVLVLGGRPVTLGLNWEVTRERRLGFDLDARSQRGRDVLDHEVKLDARWALASDTTLFLQAVALAERRIALRDGAVQKRHWWERGQTWLQATGLGGTPWALQVGRVALIDRRAWWWDDDLDAVRLSAAWPTLRIDTGLAREVLKLASTDRGIDPAQRGVVRWFGHAAHAWRPDHVVEAYALLQADRSGTPEPGALVPDGLEDSADGRLRWLGLRATGEWRTAGGHRLGWRGDLATLGGRERRTAWRSASGGQRAAGASTDVRLRAWALDLGATWRLPGAARPTFSVGLARGSGGGTAALDRRFRQTGLHENKARVAGVKRMRLYGELLRPELSNLQVASAGFGWRLLERTSLELMAHRYRQLQAEARVAGSRLSVDPLGTSRAIGREVDLLLAVREWQALELTLLVARFTPGAAYAGDRRDPAHAVELGVTFTF